jgi:hypothetical protein
MFGVGYRTNQEKGANIHRNVPVDMKPENIHNQLSNINYIIEHDERSPLWRIFYDYCGEWWSHEEMGQIILGKGDHWERLREQPRSLLVHIFHSYAAYFFRENIESIKLSDKIKSRIIGLYKKILNI